MTVINSTSLGSDNTNLMQFLAEIVNYQSWSMQGLTTNSFGNALYSIYVSSSGGNSSNSDMTNLILREMVSFLTSYLLSNQANKHGFRNNTGGVSSSSPERYVFFFNSIQSSRMNLNHTPVVTIRIFGVPTHCSDRCMDPSERHSDNHDHGMVPQVGDMGVYDHSHHDRRVYDVCRCRLHAV